MIIQHFFHPSTSTLTYIVHKQGAKDCIIIDPTLDFFPNSGKLGDAPVTELYEYLKEHSLTPTSCLETHVHADHISASQVLKSLFPTMEIAIHQNIVQVQETFWPLLELAGKPSASHFDHLFEDGEIYHSAGFDIKIIATPGHTPACASIFIEDAVFTGDTLFMPDFGVGRCDFPGGSAESLYRSVTEKLFTLPDTTRVFTGHDYQPGGRELQFQSTIKKQKQKNIILHEKVSRHEFVEKRESKDSNLDVPKLLYPSLQVNMLAGKLPQSSGNNKSFIKIPLHTDFHLVSNSENKLKRSS